MTQRAGTPQEHTMQTPTPPELRAGALKVLAIALLAATKVPEV